MGASAARAPPPAADAIVTVRGALVAIVRVIPVDALRQRRRVDGADDGDWAAAEGTTRGEAAVAMLSFVLTQSVVRF